MNITKLEFQKSIQTVADHLGETKSKSYAYLLKNVTLPEIIKMIIYDCFLLGMNFQQTKVIKEIEIIREYSEELNIEGYVTFK
jgi:hypothetical protein